MTGAGRTDFGTGVTAPGPAGSGAVDPGRPRPRPTFVIIGAQKSATRWLRVNLGRHPEIFTAPQEVKFFHSPERIAWGREWYLDQFEGWDGERIVGEATPSYMMWRHEPGAVAARIHEFNPSFRVLAILRNPVDRAYSGFVHHMRRGRIPPDAVLLDYIRANDPEHDERQVVAGGWYAASLAPFRERFGDQLLVLLNDDARRNPLTVYRQALDHVGASPRFVPEGLDEVLFGNTPPPESSLRKEHGAGYRDLTDEERCELYELFRDDISALEDMLGRDLSLWRPVS